MHFVELRVLNKLVIFNLFEIICRHETPSFSGAQKNASERSRSNHAAARSGFATVSMSASHTETSEVMAAAAADVRAARSASASRRGFSRLQSVAKAAAPR